MLQVIEWLLLLSPLIWELTTDYYRIEVLKKEDNHTEDVYVRVGIIAIAGLVIRFLPLDKNAIQAWIFSASIFIAFFDYVLNLLRHKKLNHKGTNPTDKILAHLPFYGEVFTRVWILGVGWCFYYRWDLIFTK